MFSMKSFRIWFWDDDTNPMDLIEGSSISLKGFERLKDAAMNGKDFALIINLFALHQRRTGGYGSF
jgi:hypothetical protein